MTPPQRIKEKNAVKVSEPKDLSSHSAQDLASSKRPKKKKSFQPRQSRDAAENIAGQLEKSEQAATIETTSQKHKSKLGQVNSAFDEAENEGEIQKQKKKRKRAKKSRSSSAVDFPLDASLDIDALSDDIVTSDDSPIKPTPISQDVGIVQSQGQGKLFVEHDKGFKSRAFTDTIPQQLETRTKEEFALPTSTPTELANSLQKIFRTFAVFCHGLLAGIGLLHCIFMYNVSVSQTRSYEEFVDMYSNLAMPLQCLFYTLLVICTLSVFDRYDVSHVDGRFFQRCITMQSAAIVIIIYVAALALSVSIANTDDRLSLYRINVTYWEDPAEAKTLLNQWKIISLCRSVMVILGWLLISLRPGTDVLAKRIKALEQSRTQESLPEKQNGFV